MANNKYIDLHMHSFYSGDGEFSEEELVKKCFDAGVKIMAISDHNYVKANKKAQEECNKYGIKYINAIEIDCTYRETNFHVLGYGVDINDDRFNALGENIRKQEVANDDLKIELTKKLGFEVSKDELYNLKPEGAFPGETFAEVIFNDERYQDNELLKPYREGGSRSDNPIVNFYWDYYAQGKPCYTKTEYPKVKEIIDLIHETGGKAVLAHPGNNLKGQFEWFEEMAKLGFDGVEAFSTYHTKETCAYFYNKAKEFGIYTTCGSDFHGKTKKSIFLGETNCYIDEKEIENNLKEMGLI